MKNIWLSKAEIMALPTSGQAWDTLVGTAEGAAGEADLSDQDSKANVQCLAAALVYARIGQQKYLDRVLPALRKIAGGLPLGRALALGRELCAYVIAADLIDLPAVDATLDNSFSIAIEKLLTAPTSGGPANLVKCHEQRPNNWGTHAGASRIAVALYLGDRAELDKAAKVFHGWLGDRTAYTGFTYGDLAWQADPKAPVGVNPKGAQIQGHSVDGVIPDDLRRGGGFKWPPASTGYPWEAMQGATVQAELLSRAGYPAWNWCDKALLRAAKFLYGINWPAQGDDGWQPWLVNSAYGTSFPTVASASPGKNMGFTAWTHAKAIVRPPVDPPPPPPPPDPTPQPDVAAALAALRTAKAQTIETMALLTQAITALGG